MNYYMLLTILILTPVFVGFGQDSEVKDIKNIAPHMPDRPDGELMELDEYRFAMDQWVMNYPEEFEKAVALDASLNVFAPMKSRAAKPDDRPLTLPPVGTLPAFMNYPVNKTKPYFVDNNNPDYDSLVFKRKLQHWYFLFDKELYLDKYGELPNIPDSVEILTHPDQFAPEVDKSQYEGYYPEFK